MAVGVHDTGRRSLDALLALAVSLACLAGGAGCGRPAAHTLPADHVLASADLTGWTVVGEPALYDASTLYQRVNGEDVLYLDAGFTQLTHIELRATDRGAISVEVDLYELGSPLSAFGVYSRLHDDAAVVPETGASACRFGGLLVMYQDRYLARLTLDPASPRDERADLSMVELARKLAAGLPGTAAEPCELSYLPADGLERGSRSYVEKALFGHEFLPGGLTASYRLEGQTVVLFVSRLADGEAAADGLRRYRSLLADGGSDSLLDEDRGLAAVAGREPTGHRVSVAASGPFLVGVRSPESLPDSGPLLLGALVGIEGAAACSATGAP